MATFCILSFILFSCISHVLPTDPYEAQPKILTEDGHLFLISGNHRNITFRTSGQGFVNLNGVNLVQIASMAKTASENVEKIQRTVIAEFQSSLDSTVSVLNGPDGLARRVAIMESMIQNGSFSAAGSRQTSPYLRNRVNALSKRVNNLQRQVRQLTALLTTDECLSNPCRNGGTCIDMFNGFTCKCTPSWEGTLCDVDVNECLHFAGTDLGCQNGATCVNKAGSYECLCQSGWYGLHCTQQTNDCKTLGSTELCGHGICVNQVQGSRQFTCICNQGWKINSATGACTEDVDECISNHPACSRNPLVQCINVPGSFYCGACPAGYTGNGYYCTDIDECLVNNGGCSINPRVQCINTQGSRVCSECPPGYVGDGVTCTYLGTCNVNNGGCHPLATCTAVGPTVICTCPTGFIGSGVGPNGCINSGGTIAGPCSTNPCLHGTCTISPDRPTTYICNCFPGFTGLTCNSAIDSCASSPCLNGGTCIAQQSDYSCLCNSSFTGKNCQQERQSCGGLLNSPQGSFKYPSTRSTYAPNLSCAWVIVTNRTLVLNVTFLSFHLEPSLTCKFDWLQIHDGRTSGDHLIGRFCGTQKPRNGTIISTHNALYMWFRTDKTRSGDGFEVTWNSTEPVCGGFIEVSSHGRISSPGSPGKYPHNRDCYWHIASENLNKGIEFQFFTLQIESHPNCSYDLLEIFDGSSENDPLLQRYCSTSHPAPIRTSGPYALVHFHSDSSGNDAGFQISFTTVEGVPGCGGVFTKPSGIISSPNHPDTYQHNLDCDWKIQLPVGEKAKLVFLSFSLEHSYRCHFDSLEVRDGPFPDSPLLGRFCGNQVPNTILSTTNNMFIRFQSDWSRSAEGFRIKYEALCGGVFSGLSGILTSPYYPRNYPENRICIYEIALQPGKAITLQFLDFDVEDTSYPRCYFDFLEVHDGDNENSTLIGKYCGEDEHTIPPPVTSTHNYLWLKFRTDSSISNKGFKANYTALDVTCGGIYKDMSGVIQSPLHEDSYPSNSFCRWVIVAKPGWVVQLSFSTFSLEHNSWSSDPCSFDYVAVYDNSSIPKMGGLMGKFCGSTIPPVMTTSDNVMTIVFKSDWSFHMEGFTASYITRDATKLCGVNFYSIMGQITSPNYPEYYPHNKNCAWTITVPTGRQIELNFTDFKLESHTDCRFDFLEIRNGGYETSPLLNKFCGTTIPSIIRSSSNQLFLRFVSDFSGSAKGFRILWDGTTTGCGGVLTSTSGSIISPNYPQPYGHRAECFWKISVARGSAIQITIVDLALETSGGCYFDYIQLYDGRDTTGKSLGRYCNTGEHPVVIISKTNNIYIKFRSDSSRSGRGFSLRYNTVCNRLVNGSHGVIESPNYPSDYPPNLDCTWNIAATRGNKLNLTFTSFQLEGNAQSWMPQYSESTTCPFDYLEIKEGNGNDPPTRTIGRYCGQDTPPYIASTMDHIYVHFVTDLSNGLSGFRLEWVLNGCGGQFYHPEGTITSPNYPNHYSYSTTCEWTITVDYDKSIELTIEDFNMERSTGCRFDSLTVYGGPDDSTRNLTQLCSSQLSTVVVTSSGNNMFLRFTSDGSFSGRGFKASYKTVPTRCGGKFTTPSGNIFSHNYPDNYDNHDDCLWYIEVDETHVVKLSFQDFDLEGNTGCTYDYLRIFDGNTTEHPVLLNHCGNKMPNVSSIRSTSNKMLLRMKADSSRTAKGFLANYTIACGAKIITEDSGVIEVRDSINVHPDNSNCTWIIKGTQSDDHVTLTITHIDFDVYQEDTDECPYHMLKVYDGEDKDAPLIGTFCNSRSPPPIVSQGSAMVIEIVAPWGIPNNMFQATYSVLSSACGGNLTSLHGTFTTPGFPNGYPPTSECVWYISASVGNKVHLSFNSFDVRESDNCNEDYVEVRQSSGAGPLIGIYCGSDIPSNVTNSRSLWIKFHSSGVGTANGFIADYSLVHGNDLFGASGQIASPLYPRPFIQVGEFSWRITVDFGKVISVAFTDFYVTAYHESCYYSIKMYDGYDNTGPLLFEACGSRLPDPVTSSSNIVYITFDTGPGIQGSWFLLNWLQVERYTVYPPHNPTTPGCGETFTFTADFNATSYNLTSPGYPHGYAHNLNCEWIIESAPEFHLQLFFNDMDFDHYGYCYQDYVEVYTGIGGTQNWQKINTYCLSNSTLEPAIESTNLMKIVFHSDFYGNKTGFSAEVIPVCGGSLTQPSGYINTEIAKRVMSYRRGTRYALIQCEWNITARTGRTIAPTFDWIHIANIDSHCSQYFVILQNGGSASSPMLGNGKYCGDVNYPLPINETTGNMMHIRYYGPSSSLGFKLRYQELSITCGETVYLTKETNTTYFTTPNYPHPPHPHSECLWIFIAPGSETLQLDFIDRFDIHFSDGCETEYVEVRDGGTQHAKLFGRYCDQQPGTLKTTGNVLHVKYFSDTTTPNSGFKAKVSLEICGGTVRGRDGYVASPGHPVSYPNNFDCEWRIIGPDDRYLDIKITDLDTPPNRECTSVDYVSITDIMGFNDTENLLGTFCGENKPQSSIQTAGNEGKITFHSDNEAGYRNFRGFRLQFNASEDACGETVDSPSGIITSPRYPFGTSSRRVCIWKITVPEGRRVSIQLLDWDVQNIIDHYWNKIWMYGDFDYNARIAIINDSIPTNFSSTSNKLMLYYYTDYNAGHRGFKVRYSSDLPAVCGGSLEGDAGYIQQPEAALGLKAYSCIWKKVVSQNKTFTLTILNATIGTKQMFTCSYTSSVIKIYLNGDDTSDIMRLCGNYTKPYVISSPYSLIQVKALQGEYYGQNNFTIKYNTSNCGGIIQGPGGTISSPNYPRQYPVSTDCVWSIEFPEGQAIKLHFTAFKLEPVCEKDYVDIYNGPSLMSPKLTRFCGDTLPSDIISQSNRLWVAFHSDDDTVSDGFSFTLEPEIKGCGGVIQGLNREIFTPNFPKEYPNNAECDWVIKAEDGYTVQLQFIERFHLEDSTQCTKDSVEIYDYVDDSWLSLRKICGRNTPEPLKSTSNMMRILFRSDDSATADGFKAIWTKTCGGIIEKNKGQIVSPGYPVAYDISLNCNYTFIYPNTFVSIKFKDFNLEQAYSGICKYDNVTIRAKNYYWSDLSDIGTYCGIDSPPVIRKKDRVEVIFKTDKYIQRKGFMMTYEKDECGGNVTQPRIIRSLPTNEGYNERANCTWIITAPAGKTISLRFSTFKLEYSMLCYYDWVAIYRGSLINGTKRMGLFCGDLNSNPPIVQTNENQMTVNWYTDGYYTGEGFEASVTFPKACGYIVNMTEQTRTLRYPQNGHYEEYEECIWKFFVPVDQVIELRVTTLNLEPCVNVTSEDQDSRDACDCDYLEVHDGMSQYSPLIGRFCSSVPPVLTTTSNSIYIRFVSDGLYNGNGVQAQVTAIPPVCGNSNIYINSTTLQELTSPNYPSNYPINIRCRWRFNVQSYMQYWSAASLYVHFEDLDIETGGATCNNDKLQIRETSTNAVNEGLGDDFIYNGQTQPNYYYYSQSVYSGSQNPVATSTFCGKGHPLDYYSTSSAVELLFISNSNVTSKGFKIQYGKAGCNRNYTAVQGRIRITPDNPGCVIIIQAQENHTISLYFRQFNSRTTDCDLESLVIRDGASSTSPKLAQLCGYSLPSPIFSNTSSLRLYSTLTSSYSGDSFDITYTTTDQGPGCGGPLFNYGGVFTSPMYPNNFRNNTVCRWDVMVPHTLLTVLRFNLFDMGPSATCETDFIEFYDFDTVTKTENFRTKYCGGDTPALFQGQTSHAIVKYTTSVHNGGTGWVIYFMGREPGMTISDY